MLAGQADRGELTMGSHDLGKGGLLGSGDQDQPGATAVGQGPDRAGIDGALLLQPGKGSETGSISLALVEEIGPGSRQLQ